MLLAKSLVCWSNDGVGGLELNTASSSCRVTELLLDDRSDLGMIESLLPLLVPTEKVEWRARLLVAEAMESLSFF
jgi:hypothetical protein